MNTSRRKFIYHEILLGIALLQRNENNSQRITIDQREFNGECGCGAAGGNLSRSQSLFLERKYRREKSSRGRVCMCRRVCVRRPYLARLCRSRIGYTYSLSALLVVQTPLDHSLMPLALRLNGRQYLASLGCALGLVPSTTGYPKHSPLNTLPSNLTLFMKHEKLSCMNKSQIRTVRELVTAFGGTGKLASFLEIVPSAVSNMLADNYIPRSYHLDIYLEAKRRGMSLDTRSLFGVSDFPSEKQTMTARVA